MSLETFVEANSANARASYISGAMATSAQAVAISGTANWVSGNLVTDTVYTATRVGYLDYIKNFPAVSVNDFWCGSSAPGHTLSYTVPAGSNLLIFSAAGHGDDPQITVDGTNINKRVADLNDNGAIRTLNTIFGYPLIVGAGKVVASNAVATVVGYLVKA